MDGRFGSIITHHKQSVWSLQCEEIKEPVKIGNGKIVYATKIRRLVVSMTKKNGTKVSFTLENVQYIPSFWVKLFGITAAMSKGCDISNMGLSLAIQKNELKIEFD